MIDVDICLRNRTGAVTRVIAGIDAAPAQWTDSDVRTLLTEMLLALEREKNPGSEPPPVTLRGFSWIVSAADGGVLVHLELQTGTASAGPFAIDESRLTTMINRVIAMPPQSTLVH